MSTTKIKLPLLTKLAIWWLVILGLYSLIGFIISGGFYNFVRVVFPYTDNELPSAFLVLLIMTSLRFLGSLIPIILLCMKREWAWTLAVILLFVGQALFAILSLVFSDVSMLICLAELFVPSLILVLDQKKYFAMLRQQEFAKNKDTTPPAEA